MEVVKMASDETAPARPRKIHRLRIGVNVLVQVEILFVIEVTGNYLRCENSRRLDLPRDKKFTLSDKTKRFLQSIPGKARITVFFLPNNPLIEDVQGMVTEYQ